MHVMALMMATPIERQLLIVMKRNYIKTLPIYPEERSGKYPTTFDIVRLFKGGERYEVVHGESICIFPAKLHKTQIKVLDLLETPVSLYQPNKLMFLALKKIKTKGLELAECRMLSFFVF